MFIDDDKTEIVTAWAHVSHPAPLAHSRVCNRPVVSPPPEVTLGCLTTDEATTTGPTVRESVDII